MPSSFFIILIFKGKGFMSKRIQKIKCDNCKEKIDITTEIELGNFDKIGGITYVYCPICGNEIIVSSK